jgi:hypothetical protein
MVAGVTGLVGVHAQVLAVAVSETERGYAQTLSHYMAARNAWAIQYNQSIVVLATVQ